tara:strand:- start:21353 stop:21598 length:246 start_codon:yes stop_codon:yes gene_type:complete
MERIEIKLSKEARKKDAKIKSSPLHEIGNYWKGVYLLIPVVIKTLPDIVYTNKRCLDWYEKILRYHDKQMNEFNKIFKWKK